MRHWRAKIKERDNDHILSPEWVSSEFDYITDDNIRECMIRKHLREFWGLDKPDVEWYILEEVKDETE